MEARALCPNVEPPLICCAIAILRFREFIHHNTWPMTMTAVNEVKYLVIRS